MSKKIYKGYELIKAIADGEIYYGTKFKIKDWNEIVVYEQGNLIFREILGTGEEGNNYGKTIFDLWNLDYILSADFELIEEDTIDIDKIEELDVIKSRKEIFKTIKVLYGNTFAMHLEQLNQLQNDIETVLNLIQTQQTEIEERRNTKDLYYENKELRKLLKKKDKQIEYMANFINDNTPYTKDTRILENERGVRNTKYTEQYFEYKVEEDK